MSDTHELIKMLEDALEMEERGEIGPETPLDDIPEWDSMGKINLITLLDTNFGRVLSYDELVSLAKVEDILRLMHR